MVREVIIGVWSFVIPKKFSDPNVIKHIWDVCKIEKFKTTKYTRIIEQSGRYGVHSLQTAYFLKFVHIT